MRSLVEPGLGCLLLLPVLFYGCKTPEVFFDLYGGPNFLQDVNVSASSDLGTVSVEAPSKGEFTVGGRGGVYFDADVVVEPGLAFDVSYVSAEIDQEHGWLLPLSLLALLRVPLARSETYPHGIVQPYIGAGPSLVVAHYDFATLQAAGATIDDTVLTAGADARAGLSAVLVPFSGGESLAAFVEYRFTYAEPEFEGEIQGVSFDVKAETMVHHLLVGLSLRF